MNDIPPIHAAQLLKQYGLRAVKSLGQNFLEDPHILEQIAAAAGINASDVVLEIGPGLGSLTPYLATRARQVIAVELDARLMPLLRSLVKRYPTLSIKQGDILAMTPEDLGLPEGYVVAANIPFNITSPLLRHLLESPPKPSRMVLTIQKEVAQRVCAVPPHMNILALSVQVYGDPRVVAQIPAAAFHPVPQVDSAVLRVDILPDPRLQRDLLPTFFDLVRAGFSQKRKMLRNSLASAMHISPEEAGALLQRSGIDPKRRAETLSIPEWEGIARNSLA